MNKITGFKRRHEVQIASIISTIGGDVPGRWEFALAFHDEVDAFAAAERLSEDHQYVRVVDTHGEIEESN